MLVETIFCQKPPNCGFLYKWFHVNLFHLNVAISSENGLLTQLRNHSQHYYYFLFQNQEKPKNSCPSDLPFMGFSSKKHRPMM